jgi:hypothetical protein
MDAPVAAALVTGSVTAAGWLVSNILTIRREEQRHRTEAQLKFVERQIEELYGPLAFLLHEGRRTFEDLLDALGRRYVFQDAVPLSEHELKTWLYWAEAEFLPRNEKIKCLLMTKAHLIEGPVFPDTYIKFLDHANSWSINHRRWKDQQVEYSWHSKIGWPEEFEKDVLETFTRLNAVHSALLGKLQAA